MKTVGSVIATNTKKLALNTAGIAKNIAMKTADIAKTVALTTARLAQATATKTVEVAQTALNIVMGYESYRININKYNSPNCWTCFTIYKM